MVHDLVRDHDVTRDGLKIGWVNELEVGQSSHWAAYHYHSEGWAGWLASEKNAREEVERMHNLFLVDIKNLWSKWKDQIKCLT